jgi:hypothetical protein
MRQRVDYNLLLAFRISPSTAPGILLMDRPALERPPTPSCVGLSTVAASNSQAGGSPPTCAKVLLTIFQLPSMRARAPVALLGPVAVATSPSWVTGRIRLW